MRKPLLSPWQKIMRAAEGGRPLYLNSSEIRQLSFDSAIETKAGNDDEGLTEGDDDTPRAFREPITSGVIK